MNSSKWEGWLSVIFVELVKRCPQFARNELGNEAQDTFRKAVLTTFGERWCAEFKLKPECLQKELIEKAELKSSLKNICCVLPLRSKFSNRNKKRYSGIRSVDSTETQENKTLGYKNIPLASVQDKHGYFSSSYDRYRNFYYMTPFSAVIVGYTHCLKQGCLLLHFEAEGFDRTCEFYTNGAYTKCNFAHFSWTDLTPDLQTQILFLASQSDDCVKTDQKTISERLVGTLVKGEIRFLPFEPIIKISNAYFDLPKVTLRDDNYIPTIVNQESQLERLRLHGKRIPIQYYPQTELLTKLQKEEPYVPSSVLKYLLSTYCTSENEIEKGFEAIKLILAKYFVHPQEAKRVKSVVIERGSLTIIDQIKVSPNEMRDNYEARFTNLAINNVPVDREIVERYETLLVGGMWSIVTLKHQLHQEQTRSAFVIKNVESIDVVSYKWSKKNKYWVRD